MNQAIAYPIFLLGCLLGVLRPGWTFAVVATMYAAEQLVQAAGGPFLSFPPLANYMVAVVAGISVARLLVTTERPLLGFGGRQLLLTIAIFAWSAISLAWTPSGEAARDLITEGIPYFILFVLLAPLLVTDMDSARRALWATMLLSIAVAAGILANPEVRSSSGRLGVALSATVRTSPLAIGDLGGLAIILGALLRPLDRTGMTLLLKSAAVLLGLALALMSGSRGQVLFAVGLSVAVLPMARNIRNVGGFLATTGAMAFVAGGIYLIAPIVLDRFGANRWDAASLQEGAGVRLNNALVLIEAQAERPLSYAMGLGYNAFTSFRPDYTEPYSHNVPLDIFAELGVLAFACFVTILWGTVSQLRDLHRLHRHDPVQRSVVGALAAMAGFYLLLCSKQGNLWATGPLFMMVAIISRLHARETVAWAAWSAEQLDDATEHGEDDSVASSGDLDGRGVHASRGVA
ncbi:MAG: hypothetical protein RIS86_1174 [Planctomycetota bacterium]